MAEGKFEILTLKILLKHKITSRKKKKKGMINFITKYFQKAF